MKDTRTGAKAKLGATGKPNSIPVAERRYGTIEDWMGISGMNRTAVYREIRAGNLQARKVGRRTMLDIQVGLAFIDSCPGL